MMFNHIEGLDDMQHFNKYTLNISQKIEITSFIVSIMFWQSKILTHYFG